MAKKYFIKKIKGDSIKYKRYKCVEGWSRDKNCCWKFTEQGAKKIIERMIGRIHPSRRNEFKFSIEEAD